jgi:NtrC-family two-component system sensor histidine kinase KinB
MARTVKQKIRMGTTFLFLLLFLLGSVGIFHIARLKEDSQEILKNNYESIDYCHGMLQAADSFMVSEPVYFSKFDSSLKLQESNITEPGEKNTTAAIRMFFEKYKKGNHSDSVKQQLNASIQHILQLNMQAIETKNQRASTTADQALTYISVIAGIILLVSLSFSFNFPSIVTDPLNALTEAIRQVTAKNYTHRIHLNRHDEFGEMANAFNTMAERLEYFENSNLNKIIFEKTRAEAVINSLKDASIGIDKTDIVLFANDQALQLLALPAADIVAKPVAEVKQKNELFRFLLEEKSSIPFKVVLDNHENYFTKEILELSQEAEGSKVIILRNITSFKELDTAKTNFIATISHELKTPLASSDFSLKLLEDERVSKLTNEQKELVANLKNDNQRMLKILSELLNMSQVETGKIQLEIQKIDPSSIADKAIETVLNTAKEKNISIKKEYDEKSGLVNADPEKTSWVLNNFLTNAIKYSPENSEILVSVKPVDNTSIRFSVRDNGQGIPSQYISRIFDRFFKVPGSKSKGTGLGLAISREFIEAQQGKIWVQSQPGSGSEFGFDLPAIQQLKT